MTEYRVKVKNSPGWENFDTCMVSISMGQACHEGKKLDALLAWATQNHRVRILNVSDILHRHNLMRAGLDEQDASRKAFALGNEWMQRNHETLKKYLPHFQHVHRWGDWLSHPEFPVIKERVIDFYNHNDGFAAAADQDIGGFIRRKENQGENTGHFLKRQTSFAYLMEELAAYILMGRIYAASRVYPAKPLATFQYLRAAANIPQELAGMEKSMCARVVFKQVRDALPRSLRRAA